MYPGRNTRLSEESLASATSVAPKADLVRMTGTTTLATIVPPFAAFSGVLVIVPTDGNVATTTTGNIGVAVTMPQNRATVLVFSKVTGLWYSH